MSVNSKMTAVADKIRTLLGITVAMGLDDMALNLDVAQEEVDDQAGLITQIKTALAGKTGGNNGIVPSGTMEITENGTYDVTNYATAAVNVAVSSSDDISVAILDKSISEIVNSEITELGQYTLRDCTKLTKLHLPSVTEVGIYACYGCSKLADLYLPAVLTIGQYAFHRCNSITELNLPALTKISGYRAISGTNLKKLDLGPCTSLSANALNGCSVLDTIILRATTVCTLANVSALNDSCFASGKTGGTVYVPRALITDYQVATNWSTLYEGGTCTFVAIEGSEYE